MIKTTFGVSALSLMLVALGGTWFNAQEPQPPSAGPFMRLKLEPAKNLLEGIALRDFEMIAKNAEQIRKLTLDESWMVSHTVQYRRQSEHFQKIMTQLSRAAKEEDLDAATSAYLQMTMRCVSCHEDLRDTEVR